MGTENKYIVKTLKTHDQIVEGIKGVAEKLNKKFTDKSEEVVVITILKGGLPFSSELMKHLDFDMSMDFISSSSYYLDKQLETHQTRYEATVPIKDKHIILTDDLIDSGRTMQKLVKILEAYEPKSITIAAMYGKEQRVRTNYDEFFCWDEDPGGFLLGFGLDYDEKYRNLPDLYIMEVDGEENE